MAAAARPGGRAHADWPMPGYTHLQRAQPVYLGASSARLLLDAPPRRRALRRGRGRRCGRDAARLGRARGAQLGARPRGDGRPSWASTAPAPNSIDAVASRDFVARLPLGGRDLRDPPLAARLRARALVEPGVRVLRARRRLLVGLEPHAAEEEPRRGGAAAGEGAAGRWRRFTTLAGVLHALPLAYSKDLQEDKEALFDAVDNLELCAARRPSGMLAGPALRPRAAGRGRRRRVARRDRRRRPAGPQGDAVPRGARRRRRPGPRRARARARRSPSSMPRGARRPLRAARRASSTRCSTTARRLESKRSEGGTSSERVAEQLEAARDAVAELRQA